MRERGLGSQGGDGCPILDLRNILYSAGRTMSGRTTEPGQRMASTWEAPANLQTGVQNGDTRRCKKGTGTVPLSYKRMK